VRNLLQKSQREFAPLLGISLSHYSKLEAGIGGISEKVLYAVAAQAQVSLEWLRTGQGPPPTVREGGLLFEAGSPPSLEYISAIIAAAEQPELYALAEKMSALTGVSIPQALTDLLLARGEVEETTAMAIPEEGQGDVRGT
jgi:transcriptional regulator with XRE-family HTH domain